MADEAKLLTCAETALRDLQKARDKLYSAHNMGVFDILGGGLLTSIAKHNDIDEVNRCLQNAKYDLTCLRKQLDAADLQVDLIDLGDGLRILDTWLDNIFTDLTVQDKINAAQKQVNQAIFQLQNIIARLKA